MSILKKIEQDIVQAMKAGQKDVVSTLRMAKSAINNVLIDKNKKELTDAETIDVLQKQLKKNAESLEMYIKGSRQELADKEKIEMEILKKYLPAQLSEDEIKALAEQAVAKSGASTPADTGKVMKELMPQVKGKADGKLVNQVVQKLLKK